MAIDTCASPGPYRGTPVALGTPWATFGEIIAFQGTSTDEGMLRGVLILGCHPEHDF
jgi:hypothetical protein